MARWEVVLGKFEKENRRRVGWKKESSGEYGKGGEKRSWH